MSKIKKISEEDGKKILDRFYNKTMTDNDYGRFYFIAEDKEVCAIDNETGDCWMEEFKNVADAKAWLEEYQ